MPDACHFFPGKGRHGQRKGALPGGAFGALLLTGYAFDMFAMIGMILLMGIGKKNAILLVDYINTLRQRGLERDEAVCRAGPVRLRPILMTSIATVFGILPIALGHGAGPPGGLHRCLLCPEGRGPFGAHLMIVEVISLNAYFAPEFNVMKEG